MGSNMMMAMMYLDCSNSILKWCMQGKKKHLREKLFETGTAWLLNIFSAAATCNREKKKRKCVVGHCHKI